MIIFSTLRRSPWALDRGNLSCAFQEQERGKKRRVRAGYHRGGSTCMCLRCDSLLGPDPGDTLAIDLNDGDDFYFGCAGENIGRRGGSWSCVLANVDLRHRCRVLAKFRVQTAARINE